MAEGLHPARPEGMCDSLVPSPGRASPLVKTLLSASAAEAIAGPPVPAEPASTGDTCRVTGNVFPGAGMKFKTR